MRPYAAICLMLSAALVSTSCWSGEAIVGMNRVNIVWLAPEARQRVIADMVANGVHLVRLSLSPPVAGSLDAVRMARERGMAVLLEIPLASPDFYPTDATLRPGHGRIWDVRRLSDLDPQRFRTVFRSALQDLEATRTRIVAVELGNEINWSPYNGDLHVYPTAGQKTARSLLDLHDRAHFERGLDRYIEVLSIAKDELSRTTVNSNTKIVSAGLSDVSLSIADTRGFERLAPSEMLGLLKARGLDKWADAYGMHVYPNTMAAPEARKRDIAMTLSVCGQSPEAKPCWITEWGIANESKACPVRDENRERIIKEVRKLFNEYMSERRVSKIFYFDWDGKTPYSVWRCDGLSGAGTAAVSD